MAVLRIAIGTLLCASLLAACQPDVEPGNTHVSFQHFEVNDDDLVVVHAHGKPDATVNAAGDLAIAGKPVEVTPAQRELLQRYYSQVQGIRSDAIVIGKQGVALAGKAIGEVVGGLLAGDPDRIGERVEAEAGKIEVQAGQICTRLEAIRSVQDALAADLAAFGPYATIRAEQVTGCASDIARVPPPRPPAPPAPPAPPEPAGTSGQASAAMDAATGVVDAGVDGIDAGVRGIDAVVAGIDDAVRGIDAMIDGVDTVTPGDGTPLIRAAAQGDLAKVDDLIRRGADVNKAARGDGNPLIVAANRGHADIVARLVAAGANVNAVVPGDETPLINAARGGHLDIVTYLVEHGADVNKGVSADFGRWRSPLNQAKDNRVRAYLTGKGAVAGRNS